MFLLLHSVCGKHSLIVGNLHLQHHPDLDHVKQWQTLKALESLHEYVEMVKTELTEYQK
jgi:hypothetical protein